MAGDDREETHVLEINLISAQGLKEPSSKLRRMQTYALVWIDPSNKLRTRIDRIGAENPIWNNKFFFQVSADFLSSETSGVSIEIYAVGYVRDHLLGTVRFLVSNFLPTAALKAPSLIALQIRRPSGKFQGVLNIGAMVTDDSGFFSAAGICNFAQEKAPSRRWNRRYSKSKSVAQVEHDGGGDEAGSSKEDSFSGSVDYSDGADSTASSPLPSSSSPLTDWNGIRNLAGKNHIRSSSDGGGLLCCFLMRSSALCGRVPAGETMDG